MEFIYTIIDPLIAEVFDIPHRYYPWWRIAIIQRLLAQRYAMTKVDLRPGKGYGKESPIVAAPTNRAFVVIKVSGCQKVHFKVQDLVAASGGIELESIYSTHFGANLLGLGSFHTLATGEGTLILQTYDMGILDGGDGHVAAPGQLLAWDNNQHFALGQRLGFMGLWFNPPALILSAPKGATLLDQGRSEAMGFFRHLWSLLRYMFLPF